MCTLKTPLVCKQQILIASHAVREVVGHLLRVGFFVFVSVEKEKQTSYIDTEEEIYSIVGLVRAMS